jgi:hypothetical protein
MTAPHLTIEPTHPSLNSMPHPKSGTPGIGEKHADWHQRPFEHRFRLLHARCSIHPQCAESQAGKARAMAVRPTHKNQRLQFTKCNEIFSERSSLAKRSYS